MESEFETTTVQPQHPLKDASEDQPDLVSNAEVEGLTTGSPKEPAKPINLSTNEESAMPPPMMKAPQIPSAKDNPPILQVIKEKPKIPIDPLVQEQKIAEKRAKYMEILASVKYEPPETGATTADSRYSFEVLKGGTIVDNVKFSRYDGKGFYIIGRVPACDIVAENPTVSRTHAILQFIKGSNAPSKDNDDEKGQEKPTHTGLYIYDLGSTHGTYINKNRVFPNIYYRLRVGHVLKFGNSARLYILLGPSDDEEKESDKSVTELQNEKLQKELERKKLQEQGLLIKSSGGEGDEEDGCLWGMAEDADEESDVRENPFAINFEASESFDNPKKTLRGWFEREGYELVYDCREKSAGQFICRINLPIDGPAGQAVFAEVDLKGKKKEAVAQAALQACQILDKYGVLRQSHHESKGKQKRKDWEDQDYYSSDEDTFLDRTGNVEKKREQRMKIAGKLEEKTETFESLNEKASSLTKEIDSIQSQVNKAQSMSSMDGDEEVDVDDYLKYLKGGATDVKKLKGKIRELSEELKRVNKLLEIVKPASLPIHLVSEKKPLMMMIKEEKTFKVEKPFEDITVEKKGKVKKIEEGSDSSEKNSVSVFTKPVLKSDDNKSKEESKKQPKLFGPRMPFKPPSKESVESSNTILSTPSGSSEDSTILVEDGNETSKKKSTTAQYESPSKEHADDEQESSEESDNDDVSDGEEDATKVSQDLTNGETKKRKKKSRNRQPRKKDKKDAKYDYDASDPKYAVWVPPEGQRGDGRTSLNEKLGY